jgi:hypothetical protein
VARRKRVTATVKMSYADDADLIGWWNSIPRGSRNGVMKDMMRNYIQQNGSSYHPILPKNMPQPFDPRQFIQVRDDTAWIRSAMADLPGYVERVIEHVAAMQPAVVPNGVGVLPAAAIGEEEAERRETRMKKAKW